MVRSPILNNFHRGKSSSFKSGRFSGIIQAKLGARRDSSLRWRSGATFQQVGRRSLAGLAQPRRCQRSSQCCQSADRGKIRRGTEPHDEQINRAVLRQERKREGDEGWHLPSWVSDRVHDCPIGLAAKFGPFCLSPTRRWNINNKYGVFISRIRLADLGRCLVKQSYRPGISPSVSFPEGCKAEFRRVICWFP